MFVTVAGKKIEVAVSDGGMFYDTGTKSFSAKTLEGLRKKLKEAGTDKGGIPIETDTPNPRQGIVIGKALGRGYYAKNYVRVQWSDGSIEDRVRPQGLRRRTTEEESKKLKVLEDNFTKTALECTAKIDQARSVRDEFKKAFNVAGLINNLLRD